MSKRLSNIFAEPFVFCQDYSKMKIFYFFIFSLFSTTIFSQVIFEEERLNNLLEERVNDYRISLGLPILERSEVLDAAAFDQASYLLGKSRIEHKQEHKKKETVVDRVLYYGGFYAELGENAAKVGVGGRERVYPSGDRVVINSEDQAISAALYAWMSDENSKLNISDKYFRDFGAAVVRTDNVLDIVIVFAGLPYQLPHNSKEKIPKANIKAPQKEDCSKLWEDFSTIPQLFSDALKVEGNEVVFEFHSLPTVEKIISNSSDGIGVDVICDNQFTCGNPNRLYPSEVNDGFLLPISRKGKLTALNSLKEENKINVKLGKLPDFYDPARCELNGIIIKNGTKCSSIHYNKYDVLDLRQLKIPYQLIGDKLNGNLQWEDTLDLTFSIKSEGFDVAEIYKQLKAVTEALSYQIDELTILQEYDPTLDVSKSNILESLQKKIKENYPSIKKLNTSKKVSWLDYYSFQSNSIYQMETKGMDTLALKRYLKTTADSDTVLNTFLEGLNKLKLKIKGTAEIEADRSVEEKRKILQHLIAVDKVDQALVLQVDLIENHQDYTAIYKLEVSQITPNLPLINNQIIAAVLDGRTQFKGNPIYLSFLEIFLISQKYPILNYNKYLSDIKLWANTDKVPSSIESWNQSFSQLKDKEGIPTIEYAKSVISYALIAANYYYDKGDFTQRKRTFDLLMRWYPAAELNENEELELAQYFAYQDQFHRAVELLLPKVRAAKPKEDILFYFLQIAIYEKDALAETEYLELLTKSAKLYPASFCGFFSKEKRGIQALKDYDVKELYCSVCE